MALEALVRWKTLVTLMTLELVLFTIVLIFMFTGHVLCQENFAFERLATLLTV